MISLIDCNNFYVSCERVFNPRLRNKPVVVLSNNDGCVISRSNESKKIGIKMGVPAFQYVNIFKQYNVHIFSTNFELYSDLSNRVMSILKDSVSQVEVYSIDEAFLDYSYISNPVEFSYYLISKILRWTGIPVSIGIAQTKTLAKLANYLAKNESKDGLYYFRCKNDIKDRLKAIGVDNIWGIGKKNKERLNLHGIKTAYQLFQCRESWIKRYMSIVEVNIVRELHGIPCFELSFILKHKKTIRISRSFKKAIDNFNALVRVVSIYTASAMEKLRRQNSLVGMITIFIIEKKNDGKYYNYIKNIKLDVPTQDSFKAISKAIWGLKSIYKKGCKYKKAGVLLSDFIANNNFQISLFENIEDRYKRENIMAMMDKLNKRFGKTVIYPAINNIDKAWLIKQKYLSPQYTTSLKDIIRVKA